MIERDYDYDYVMILRSAPPGIPAGILIGASKGRVGRVVALRSGERWVASQKGATVYLRTLLGLPGRRGGTVDTAPVLKEVVQEAARGGGGRQRGLLLRAALGVFQLALLPPHSPVTRWPVICHHTLPLVLPYCCMSASLPSGMASTSWGCL